MQRKAERIGTHSLSHVPHFCMQRQGRAPELRPDPTGRTDVAQVARQAIAYIQQAVQHALLAQILCFPETGAWAAVALQDLGRRQPHHLGWMAQDFQPSLGASELPGDPDVIAHLSPATIHALSLGDFAKNRNGHRQSSGVFADIAPEDRTMHRLWPLPAGPHRAARRRPPQA